MAPVLWIIVALLVAGAIVFATSLKTRRSLPPVELPDGDSMPRTPLQKKATRSLLAVLANSASHNKKKVSKSTPPAAARGG